MSIAETLSGFRRKGVEIWFEADRLRFRAPKGALSQEDRAWLSQNKEGVLASLIDQAQQRRQSHPVSFGQRALWFIQQQAPESSAYHVSVPVRVKGPVAPSALRKAVQALNDRHPSLRTAYAFENGELLQVVAGWTAASFEARPMGRLTDAEFQQTVEDEAAASFDLAKGPLLRVRLYSRAPDDHVLVLTAHHIAADAWSLLTLFDEMTRLYEEFAGGALAGLPALPTSYIAYTEWQSQLLDGPEGERLWEYWKEKMAAPREALQLPLDHTPPPAPSFEGAAAAVPISAELARRMRELGARLGVTPFVLWLATFKAFLASLTNARDVIVGTPTFGRSRSEFMPVVGNFVNSVPLRSRIDAETNLESLAGSLRTTVMEALDAQEFPFSRLVQLLHPGRAGGVTPVFSAFFVLQRFDQFKQFQNLLGGSPDAAPMTHGGLDLSPFPLRQRSAQFDLSLQMIEVKDGITAAFWYSADVFEHETVDRLAKAYAAFVGALVDQPQTAFSALPAPSIAPAPETDAELESLLARLGTIDAKVELEDGRLKLNAPKGALDAMLRAEILAQRDRLIAYLAQPRAASAQRALRAPRTGLIGVEDERRMAEQWNRTEAEHDRSLCAHDLVERAVAAGPDRIAVAGEVNLTYAELEAGANRLARLLVRRGVARGSAVALCLDRTVDMPMAALAVWKAGGAYVPLDPGHPADRLRYIIEDAGAVCVVTLSRYARLFADAPAVLLDGDAAEISDQDPTPFRSGATPGDLAYLIYTSGSTGRPKGVEVEHRNLVAFLDAMRREPGLTRDDAVLAVTTLSFDIAGLEFWLPLSLGARVVVATREDALDGARLAALVEERSITMLQATPATWRLLLEAGWRGKSDLTALCGGEAMPPTLAQDLLPRVAALWNMYGPTETTIWSTAGRVVNAHGPISIGAPIANTRVYVLDGGGRIAPLGVVGELVIAGEGVARGYHDRPDLTDRAFGVVRIAGREERIYRTGDLARLRADGALDYFGRRDQQVKVRGYRIELGEIESVLAAAPGVSGAVVAVKALGPGDDRLVGYVTLHPRHTFDPEGLRALLRSRLPEYMTPAHLLAIDAVPLTPNGKIDRGALPAPSPTAGQRPAGPAAPMTDAQRRVAAIWASLLHTDSVGLHDNFFDLGGHSLLLVKLQAAIRGEFGHELTLVDFFQHTTVAAQAERLTIPSRSSELIAKARARATRQIS